MTTKFDIALDDKGTVELSDDGFEIDGWLEMKVEREQPDGTTERMTVEIHVRDMNHALAPYLQKYWENKEHDL